MLKNEGIYLETASILFVSLPMAIRWSITQLLLSYVCIILILCIILVLTVFAERYQEYFTTPYFVFIRDTLSYLALLGLHFALCLEPSSIPFSGLEWAILVFFLGRILMESRQFLGVQEKLKSESATKKSRGPKAEEKKSTRNLRGSAYQFCGEEAEEEKGKAAIFLLRCKKYLRYNITTLT